MDEQVQGGKVIVYDDMHRKWAVTVINPNVDISVAQNVMLNQVAVSTMVIWLVRVNKR